MTSIWDADCNDVTKHSTLWLDAEIKGRYVAPAVTDIAVWGEDIVYSLFYQEAKNSEYPVRFMNKSLKESVKGLSGIQVLGIVPISSSVAVLKTTDGHFLLRKDGQKKRIEGHFLGKLPGGFLLRIGKGEVGYFTLKGDSFHKVATLNIPEYKQVIVHDSMIIFVRSCATLWVAMLKQSKTKTTLKFTQEFRLKKRLFGLLCDSIEKPLSHGDSVFVALKSGRLLRLKISEVGHVQKVELSRPSFDFRNVFSLAFANEMFFLGMDDGTVQVWKDGKKVRVIPFFKDRYSPVLSLLVHKRILYVGRSFGTLSRYSF